MTPEQETPEIRKVDGRTREGRAQRAAARNVRAPVRQQAVTPGRSAARDGVYLGRNGEQLTRTRVGGIDPFHVDPAIVPKGWSYQWNVVSVVNNQDVTRSISNRMYMNGWRPVPAERHDGLFMPIGHKGEIIVDGQRLEERPLGMTNDALEEDRKVAMQLMRDRDQSLMGGKANLRNTMPDGFAMDKKYRGTGGDLRMSIDQALDVPSAAYELAEPGE